MRLLEGFKGFKLDELYDPRDLFVSTVLQHYWASEHRITIHMDLADKLTFSSR